MFLIFTGFVHAEKSNYLKVREFKNYREFFTTDGIFIADKKINTSIYFIKNENNLKINRSAGRTSFYFEKKNGSKVNYIVYKKEKKKERSKIGFFSRELSKYFKDSLTCSNLSSYKSITEYLKPDSFVKKLRSIDIDKIIDNETCKNLNNAEKDKLQNSLLDTFELKSSFLKECFESKAAQDIFDKDDVYRDNALEVFGKYINLVNKITSANINSIKIKCGLPKSDTNKLASYDENLNEISISVTNNKFDFPESDADQILFHELVHYGSKQFICKKDSKCLDESFANQFENICSGKIYEPSSQIFINCQENKITNQEKSNFFNMTKTQDIEKSNDNKPPPGAGGQIATIAEQAQLSAPAQAAEVTAALQSAPPVFEQMNPVDVQRIAIEPLTTTSGEKLSVFEGDGKYHNVVASSEVLDSFNRTAGALSASVDSADLALTSAMGKAGLVAAAVIGPNAVAASGKAPVASATTNSKSVASVGPLTTTEIVLDRYLPNDPKVQAILNDPKLDSMSYADKEKYFRSLAGASSNLAQIPKSDTALKAASLNGNSKIDKNVAGIQQRTLASTGGGAIGPNSINTSGSPGAQNLKSTGSNEISPNEPALQNNADQQSEAAEINVANKQAAAAPVRLDSKTLQRLVAFAEIKEPEYTNIRSQYKSADFIQLLNIRKIQIYSQTGKPLWVSKNKPEKCFKDNENSKLLKQVPCQ